MNKKNLAVHLMSLLLLGCFLFGCSRYSQAQFTHWSDDAILPGGKGAFNVVEDVEFWSAGEPSKPYKVIGLIQQNTITNLDYILKSYNQSELVRLVRENGGDGLVMIKSDQMQTGTKSDFSVNPNYTGGINGQVQNRAVYQNKTVLAVFKYATTPL